jgi:hypothetical protein
VSWVSICARTGQLVDEDLQRARDDLQPGRRGAVAEGLAGQLERVVSTDCLRTVMMSYGSPGRTGRRPLAVDLEVAVGDQLAGQSRRVRARPAR